MKCCYHPRHDAVGLCYYCHRALCTDCLQASERGLACKGQCERKVASMLSLRATQLSQRRQLLKMQSAASSGPSTPNRSFYRAANIFFAVLTLLLLAAAAIVPYKRGLLAVAIGLAGTLCSLGIPYYRYRFRTGGDL